MRGPVGESRKVLTRAAKPPPARAAIAHTQLCNTRREKKNAEGDAATAVREEGVAMLFTRCARPLSPCVCAPTSRQAAMARLAWLTAVVLLTTVYADQQDQQCDQCLQARRLRRAHSFYQR